MVRRPKWFAVDEAGVSSEGRQARAGVRSAKGGLTVGVDWPSKAGLSS